MTLGQTTNSNSPKLTQAEKLELKKDKEAFKATLSKEQIAKLAAIKKAKKEANLKVLPKKERKVAEKKFKAQKKCGLHTCSIGNEESHEAKKERVQKQLIYLLKIVEVVVQKVETIGKPIV